MNSKIRPLVIILWQAEEEEWQCVGYPITTVPKWNLALAAAERPYTPLILVGRELKLGQFRQQEFWRRSRRRNRRRSRRRSTVLLEDVIYLQFLFIYYIDIIEQVA